MSNNLLFADVQHTYSDNKEKLKDGVTLIDGNLFVKASFNIGRYYNASQLEMKAMLATQRYLFDYYHPISRLRIDLPFDATSSIRKELLRRIKSRHKHSYKIVTPSRVLFNGRLGKKYTYVTAVPYNPHQKETTTQDIHLTREELLVYLKEYRCELVTEDDEDKIIEFYNQLGSVEDALFYASVTLSNSIDLTNFPIKEEAHRLIFASGSMSDKLEKEVESINSYEKAIEILNKIQSHPKALYWISETKLSQKQFVQSIYISLMRLIDNIRLPRKYVRINKAISENSSGHKEAWREYSLLLKRIEEFSLSYPFQLQEEKGFTPYYLINTFGHLNFNSSVHKEVTSQSIRAQGLFNKGIKLKEIIQNLNKSITLSPANPDAFRLLGASLIAKKDYLFAIVNLNQALSLAPESADVKVNLARCYLAFGYKSLANGMAWSALLSKNQSEWSIKTALEILKKYS